MTTSNDNRPNRMYQNGRLLDNSFDSEEILYRRFSVDEFVGDRLLPAAIDFPDWSVNRSKYSFPGDVRFPSGMDQVYSCCGVAQFKVSDIPEKTERPSDDSPEYTFKVKHRPEIDNYSHSEIWTYKDGHHPEVDRKELNKLKKGINRKVKKEFRTRLSDKTFVVESCQPNICLKSNSPQ